MKYTVTTTENGFIEELEFEGKTCRKEWVKTGHGMESKDLEFWEQLMKDDVTTDGYLIDAILDTFDTNDIGDEMYRIEQEFV